jgi:hypothetical protein
LLIEEPISAEPPKLTWRDSVQPVVLAVAVAAIVHYAFSRFIFGPLTYILFFTPSNSPALPAGSGELAIVAVIAGVILALKARDRLVEWTYCLPAVMVALWSVSLFISGAAREVNRAELARQYMAERKDLETKMQDPTFLMTLKPPLSRARREVVFAALGDGERTRGIPLTSAEVHAILTNLGSDPEVEHAVAASSATSVDDLQWLALHGSKFTRVSVGENPHISPETRSQLMDDPDGGVSYSTGFAAATRGCDVGAIRTFWERESSWNLPNADSTFRALAGNPCTPKDILCKLRTFPDPVGPSAAATLHSLSAR